ncbi:MAG TPA: glycosyl hydrolase, partial [Roseiflexaceae bacterium]|nr:glycosyl hydrolase [Roseiflexaceae bacterium]
PDLFFEIGPDSARVRYDFHSTLTELYSDAYYRQIHEWCQQRGLLFTGHLLYEEWLRRMIRVEGNPFKHYRHMDVIGVDHLYPFIGTLDRPDEHVAIKLASSAVHQFGSQRLLCESFGGIFMDATMQRMKWLADWEYVLGVTLLNPHGFHYTLEGPRKRDWPPSMFYQYPWWHYYGAFSDYISRLSHMLTGGRHVAKVAVLWPINAMFATYTPQTHNPLGDRTERDFNTLTDLLLRLHYDFDYLDEDVLAEATIGEGAVRVGDETYELLILPPMAHLKLGTVERLEQFVGAGGKLLGTIFLPDKAFAPSPPSPLSHQGRGGERAPLPSSPGMGTGDGGNALVDISERIAGLFGVGPAESQRDFRAQLGIEIVEREHAGGGKASFLRSYALARQLPARLQRALGAPGRAESPLFVIETEGDASRYYFAPPDQAREEITAEVQAERQAVADTLQRAIGALIAPDVTIDNPEIFYLHRVKDGQDLYFLVNPTFSAQRACMSLAGQAQPVLWDPSTGAEQPIVPWRFADERTQFELELAPAGSAFVLAMPAPRAQIVETNVVVTSVEDGCVEGYSQAREPYAVLDRGGRQWRVVAPAADAANPLTLDGTWEFAAEGSNALVIGQWLATPARPGVPDAEYAKVSADTAGWQTQVAGAWSYQLPAEPETPYPLDVWYRIGFVADYLPPKLELIVDGFAGSGWRLYVNGEAVTVAPVRSFIDSQMLSIDITKQAKIGENVIAICMTVTSATDGLLDLLKLVGDFSLAGDQSPITTLLAMGQAQPIPDQSGYRLAAPRCTIEPGTWTTQGYPFFSGRATYRHAFELPAEFAGQRVFVEPAMGDDALEVLVNGQSAGVRLWAPYAIEISDLLRPGENTLELRVANTLVNMIEATQRPSGIAGAPRLVAYRRVEFTVEESCSQVSSRQ